MKKIKNYIFFITLLTFLCHVNNMCGQVNYKKIKGVIIDESKNSLPYVNIGIANTNYGTVSDENGRFSVEIPSEEYQKSTLKFSCIGYKDNSVLLSSITNNNEDLTITMLIDVKNLESITIRPDQLETEVIGHTHKRGMLSNNFAIGSEAEQNLGSEIGEAFFLKGETTYLNKLSFYINSNSFDSVDFRLNIYNVENGLPNKNLLTKNLYIPVSNKYKGWVNFDLKPYSLAFDEDIIVSLQWVNHSKKGKSLSLPITIPSLGHIHYYKYGSQGVWKKYPNMATPIYLEVEKKS